MPWTYILYNDAFGPQIYKVGTCDDINRELETYNKYYISPCRICHTIYSDNKNIYKIINIILKKYTHHENKSLLNCHIDQIKNTFDIARDISEKVIENKMKNKNTTQEIHEYAWR